METSVPKANFRLEHSFSSKPDLDADLGPGKGILIGQNVERASFESIFIGKQAEPPFRNVWLDTRGAHVVYVMGKRRSGKSYTLGVIAEGLASSTWLRQGEIRQGILILDTMNVYLTMIAEVEDTFGDGADDVKVLRKWKIAQEDVPVTLFRPRGTTTPKGVASTELSLRASDLSFEEWCGLFEADPFADPLGHIISELHAKVCTDGYVDSRTSNQIAAKPDFSISDLLQALERDADLQRYHRDTRESLRRRLDAVRRLPVFSDDGLDVRQLLKPGQISVLLLRDLDFQLRAVMVALIVKKVMALRALAEQQERMIPIHEARAQKHRESDPVRANEEVELARECREVATQGLPRSWLIIDEAHNYLPSNRSVASRRPLKKFVDEGRNLGLSIVVATQRPSGLDPSIQRNADVLLVHALSHRDDISAAEGMINTACPDEVILDARTRIRGNRAFEGLVRRLPLGYALASTDRANRLFPLRVRPRITVHGGADY